MGSKPHYQQFLFTDLVSGNECLLVFSGDDNPIIVHAGCENGADIFSHLDAFYCTACGCNGRISGHWVMGISSDRFLSGHYCA